MNMSKYSNCHLLAYLRSISLFLYFYRKAMIFHNFRVVKLVSASHPTIIQITICAVKGYVLNVGHVALLLELSK